MSILDRSIWYERQNNKVIMDQDVYTELVYRINNLENENKKLKKQKDDVVEYIKKNWYSKNTRDINEVVIGDWRIDLLRMLGEKNV